MAQTTTITVGYVNPPRSEGGPGSIKDSKGNYWTLWPDKMEELGLEGTEGQSFLVTYQTKVYKGKQQRTIIGAVPAAPKLPIASAAAAQPPGISKDKHIFVCGALNSWYSNPNVNPAQLTMVERGKFVADHMALYDMSLGKKPAPPAKPAIPLPQAARPSLKDEMQDEIPDFNDDPNFSTEETLDQ